MALKILSLATNTLLSWANHQHYRCTKAYPNRRLLRLSLWSVIPIHYLRLACSSDCRAGATLINRYDQFRRTRWHNDAILSNYGHQDSVIVLQSYLIQPRGTG